AGGAPAQAAPTPAAAPAPAPRQGTGCSGHPGPNAATGDSTVDLALALDVCLTTKYELKKKRHTGTYRLDLRKYTASKVVLPFAENIGDLRQYLDDPAVFRRVNLDDPLYQQREIAAAVNGLELADFDGYLNSVAVQLRKRHQGGEPTFDEVRIDRATFDRTGNEYKLLYGWKGDDDRDAWLAYEYRAQWSFAGGSQIATDWQPASFSVIPLDPPFERREIRLEGSPDYLAEADAAVRSITVRVFHGGAGEAREGERTEQVTLRADKGELSDVVKLVLPAGQLSYDYEISWRLRGNRTVTTGRRTTTEDVLYVDELPEPPAPPAS
ncbi:MAG: hypothetical protein KC560_21125, partial [Myxococcales bacterium]|nr:hypothetical protein [Myxococcales bacterium]